MSNRRNKGHSKGSPAQGKPASPSSSAQPQPESSSPPPSAKSPRPTGARLWAFRFAAVIIVPLVLLLVAELALRIVGYGYPTGFLKKYDRDGKQLFVQNSQFGWRFFGPAMAREADPFAVPRSKPPKTIRVVVFGESAAFGDPQSAFSVSRMLQAMLEKRHPGFKFEIVNSAITGINSNVILPIAEDCQSLNADVWVIYMGNNEVVGPFGSGTVFGPQAPSRSLIRASLALKSTRLGELFEAIRRKLHPPPTSKSEWGGMEMFLDQQVRADDSRMSAVYRNFELNLADIIRAGRKSGAGVVVSTVAVNLKDSSPFASSHRPGLTGAESNQWSALFAAGIASQQSNQPAPALEQFRNAAKIDGTFAELRFRIAQCALALGDIPSAQSNFIAARDLDTLRFRCDSHLNEIIRSSVPAQHDSRVLLADAEKFFAGSSPNGLPGQDDFYEHVHLTFAGNYQLAGLIAPLVDKLLPASVVPPVPENTPWATIIDCGNRLAWGDWTFQSALTDMLQRLRDPPFNTQITHDAQAALYSQTLGELASILATNDPVYPIRFTEAAISSAPDDARIWEQLASLYLGVGSFTNAEAAARRAVALLPGSGQDWFQLGLILGAQQQFNPAAEAFRTAVQIDPQDVWSLCNLGHAYWQQGRHAEGIDEYRRALAIKPRFGPGWQGLGSLLEASGKKEEAESCYRLAITNRIHRPSELTSLAVLCSSRGWIDDAAKIYGEAVQLSPADGRLLYEAGMSQVALERRAFTDKQAELGTNYRTAAASLFARATHVAPNLMQAHFMYASETDNASVAVQQFQEAVRLAPDVIPARLNLVIALEIQGNFNEAKKQVDEILKRDPSNAKALELKKSIDEKMSVPIYIPPN